MKVNSSNGLNEFNSYVQNVKTGESPKKSKVLGDSTRPSAPVAANTDKLTISREAAANAELSRITQAISAEVDEVGNAEKLEKLRAAIESGEYFVSTDELADAILGHNEE